MTVTWRRLVLVGAGAAAIVVAVVVLPVRTWLVELVAAIRGAGIAGAAGYGVVYVAAAVLMIPGSVLTLGAGFAYGPIWGTAVVIPASLAAATVAFAIGRRVGRDWIARRVRDNPRFAAIDRTIGRSGLKLTILLRLTPVLPFGLLNYALALTEVRFRHYLLGSALGMLPATILYVYLGSLLTTAADVGAGPSGPAARAAYWGGLVVSVVVVAVITVIARRALRRELEVAR